MKPSTAAAGLILTIALASAACRPANSPTASAAPTAFSGTCPTPPPADTSTVDGWMGYLAAHPDRYGLEIRTLDGQVLRHRASTPLPTASAIKVVHLAAYAQAVATQRIRPNDSVSVADWERWYFPLDGGAHRQALRYLKIPQKNGIATEPQRRVTFAQLADVMIRFSDSAAPDLIRERLGDAALRTLMQRYHLGSVVPSLLGLYLAVVDRSLSTAAARDDAARRYVSNPAYARSQLAKLATLDPTQGNSESTITAPASGLTELIGAIADDSFGPGSRLARSILEYQGPDADGTVLGFKGGSLPGVLAEVFEVRTPDGRHATGTLLVHGMSTAEVARDNFTHQQFLLGALTNPAAATRLRCIV